MGAINWSIPFAQKQQSTKLHILERREHYNAMLFVKEGWSSLASIVETFQMAFQNTACSNEEGEKGSF